MEYGKSVGKTPAMPRFPLPDELSLNAFARTCLIIEKRTEEIDRALGMSKADNGEELMRLLNDPGFGQKYGFTTYFPQIERSKIIRFLEQLRNFRIDLVKNEIFDLYFKGKVGKYDFPTELFDLVFPNFRPSSGEKVLLPYAENSLELSLSLVKRFPNCEFTLWFSESSTRGILSFLFGDASNTNAEPCSPKDTGISLDGYEYVIAFPPFGVKLEREVAKAYSSPMDWDKPRTDSDFLCQRLLTETFGRSQFIVLVPELFMYSHGSFKQIRDFLAAQRQVIAITRLTEKVLSPYTNASLSLLHFTNYGMEPEKTVEVISVQTSSSARGRRTSPPPKIAVEKRYIPLETLRISDVWNIESLIGDQAPTVSMRTGAIQLDDVARDVFRGAPTESTKTQSSARIESMRVVGVSEMVNPIIDLDLLEPHEVGLNTAPDRYVLEDGDLIITCRGNTTRISVVKMSGDLRAIPSNNVAVVRVKKEKIDPYFLYCYLMTDAGRRAIEVRQSAVSQKSLSVPDLRAIQIPSLPLDEQKKIVQKYWEAVEWYEAEKKKVDEQYQKRMEDLNRMMGIEQP